MPSELEDGLLERFVRGDEDAFESLFRRFEAEVYRWILRIVRDDSSAEDVLVEAFWRAYVAARDSTHLGASAHGCGESPQTPPSIT